MAEAPKNLRQRIFDFEKIMLFADSPEPGKRARMQFSCRETSPRITVFTGVPGSARDGMISGPMDYASFRGFLDLLEQVIRGERAKKHNIKLKYPVYENDRPTDAVKVISQLWFGKNTEGIIWIALLAEGYPKITFEFRGSKFVDFFHSDGTEFTEADKSAMVAGAMVATLRQLVPIHMHAVSLEDRITPSGKAPVTKIPPPSADFDELTY